ncbi:type IV secretion system protein [Candidatus Saccharibacteria bacterium]|nr:type IV secretion system protein [Candidatus Saccharibacteria bacterium]
MNGKKLSALKRALLILVIPVLLFSGIVTVLSPNTAVADYTGGLEPNPDSSAAVASFFANSKSRYQMETLVLLDALLACANRGSASWNDTRTDGMVTSGKWFNNSDGGAIYGVLLEKLVAGKVKDGRITCGENDNNLVKIAFQHFGISLTDKNFICDGINGRFLSVDSDHDCDTNKTTDFHLIKNGSAGGGTAARLKAAIIDQAFGGVDIQSLWSTKLAWQYYFWFDTFTAGCTGSATNFVPPGTVTHVPTFAKNTFINESNGTKEDRVYKLGIPEATGFNSTDKANLGFQWYVGQPTNGATSTVQRACTAILSMITTDRVDAAVAVFDSEKNATNTGGEYNQTTTGNGSTKDDCTIAKPLGWIICPVVNFMTDTVALFYKYIEGAMVIPSSFFRDSSGSFTNTAPYKSWDNFRNIANILFVIFFLVVIFSQLTGIGINNYGIKKILPRLVITALLINLSYFICVIAVDLSNIIGSQINNFIAAQASNAATADEAVGGFKAVMGGIMGGTGVTLGAGAAGAAMVGGMAVQVAGASAGAITGGPAILIAVIILLVVAVIACLIFFAILWIRKMALILLVVFAPLAFITFLLPNTKKLFDKWGKMFWTLLMLYPICGLVMGASKLAEKIIGGTLSQSADSSGTSLLAVLILAILPLLPVFIIPSLTKGILKLFGEMGAKLSNFNPRQAVQNQARTASKAFGKSATGQYQREKNLKNINAARAGSYTGKSPFMRARSNYNAARMRSGKAVSQDDAETFLKNLKVAKMDKNGNVIGVGKVEAQDRALIGTGHDYNYKDPISGKWRTVQATPEMRKGAISSLSADDLKKTSNYGGGATILDEVSAYRTFTKARAEGSRVTEAQASANAKLKEAGARFAFTPGVRASEETRGVGLSNRAERDAQIQQGEEAGNIKGVKKEAELDKWKRAVSADNDLSVPHSDAPSPSAPSGGPSDGGADSGSPGN